jgi:hypothetical protein
MLFKRCAISCQRFSRGSAACQAWLRKKGVEVIEFDDVTPKEVCARLRLCIAYRAAALLAHHAPSRMRRL